MGPRSGPILESNLRNLISGRGKRGPFFGPGKWDQICGTKCEAQRLCFTFCAAKWCPFFGPKKEANFLAIFCFFVVPFCGPPFEMIPRSLRQTPRPMRRQSKLMSEHTARE